MTDSHDPRPLPADHRAEAAILGAVLATTVPFAALQELPAEAFNLPAHREVAEAMRALSARGEAIDPITVGAEIGKRGGLRRLPDGETTLVHLAGEGAISEAVPHYVRLVGEAYTHRRLLALFAEYSARAMNREDTGQLVGDLVRAATALGTTSAGRGLTRIGDELAAALDVIAAKSERPAGYLIQTGVEDFDEMVRGFRAQQLIVVAARPGMGKTAFAITVARHVAKQGIPVAVFSLEMSKQELIERTLSAEAHIPGQDISTGRLSMQDHKALQSAAASLYEANMWLDDRVSSADQIAAQARSWFVRQQAGRGLVIVDYLGLIRSTGRSETRALEVGKMAWTMKALAKELDIPVMLVSQLNRENEKREGGKGGKPKLSDLRDSGEVEQHADMVVFPWREPPYHVSGPALLIVEKNRGGVTGAVECHWCAEEMTFRTARARVEPHWTERSAG